MATCDCCGIVIPSDDNESMLVTTLGRTIHLSRVHARVLIAYLADLQLNPPLQIIR